MGSDTQGQGAHLMPAAGYFKRTYTGPRPWENPECAAFSDVPDVSRGEIRFAAEVMLAKVNHQTITADAHDRAVNILRIMANQ